MVKICIIIEDLGIGCSVMCQNLTPVKLSLEEMEKSPAFNMARKIGDFVQSLPGQKEISDRMVQ
jgi:hypothetical protein